MANQVWNRLSQITSNYKNSQQAPSLNNNQYSSYYSKLYPGLNEESYNKMVNAVDGLGLTGENRANAMNNYYRTHVKTLINDQTLQERDGIINQQAYEAAKLNNKDADAELRMTEAVQKAKKLWNLDATANDREVFSSMVETLGVDGTKLAGEYLSGENDEFLYKTGLEQREKAPNERLTWGDTWDNIRTKANVPVDSMKKWGQRTFDKLGAMLYKNVLKNTLGDAADGKLGDIDNYVEFFAEKSIEPRLRENALNYQQGINERYQALEQKNLDQDIKNYYDNKGYTELIGEGDLKGFMYKSLGDAAQNREMPVVVAASVVQPEIGMALMATDSYARENQEAFENMLNNGATYEQAEQGAVVVGLVNAAVEVTLEKLIGGVETTAGDTIRKTLMKNVQEEATKKGLGRILVEGVGTQLRASGEEGLEEIVQQIVQNAAAKTVNENQELFEGVGQAFEGGFYNPMNLLAGGGNITQNISQNKDTINQQLGDTAYNAGVMTRNVVDGFTDAGSFMKDKATAIKQMAKERLNRKNGQNVTTEGKSESVWQKVVDTATRSIPEKVVENDLKLTPTERKNVERYGITPANFVLNEKIAGLSNADKVVALQDISSDAYNNVTNIFKNVIPQDYRTESKTAGKMLQTMIETMEKSDIVKEEYADYIAKLKEMKDYQTFSPYEKLAIRRDFDAIVGNDIFGANGRVKGLEDQTIAKWRADLNEEINQLGEEFGIDVKSENSRIANAITIRDGLLRALSQNKKNNAIGLQDLGIGAILSAGSPVQATGILMAKKLLENAAGNIAQGIYNMNDAPLERANTKRGAGFIQKSNPNANNNFMLSSASSDISTNPQEELVTEDIDVGANPLDTIPDRNVGANPTDLTATEEVMEEEVTTTPKKKTTKKKTSKKSENKTEAIDKNTQEKIDAYEKEINEIVKPYRMADNSVNLSDFMKDKKAYSKYEKIMDEIRKLQGYMTEDGMYTKKRYDMLNERKERVYGKQKSTWADDEGLDKNQVSSKTAAVENATVETEDGEVVSETEIETLPTDVSVEKEAKQVGEKRIAPDRVPRQQLTFDEGVKKLQDQVKAVADYIQLKTDYYNDMYGEYKGDKDSLQIMVDYSKAKKDIQNILWKDWQFKSNKSKEFVELRNNIKDNIGNEKGLEEIGKTFYISKVKKDISKGYQFPIAVLEKIPGVQKALNARERYQKGIDTSFSAKDARIDYSEQDKIGGGIKSQDGKQVTKEQKDNIVKGILDFQDVFGINVKKLAEDKGIVFVDLHGGNAFLSQASGMYRESWKEEGGPKNVSVSVGGSETIRWKDKQTKEWKTEKVNTTMSHELGHAMDYLVDKKLLDRSDYLDLYQKYKKPERRLGGFADYLKRPTEVTARAFEEYMDVAKGGDNYYDKVGYWNKDDFEYIVKPILEEAIEKKLSEWRTKKS